MLLLGLATQVLTGFVHTVLAIGSRRATRLRATSTCYEANGMRRLPDWRHLRVKCTAVVCIEVQSWAYLKGCLHIRPETEYGPTR